MKLLLTLALLIAGPSARACSDIPAFTVHLNPMVDTYSIEDLRTATKKLLNMRFKSETELMYSPLVFSDLANPYDFVVTVRPDQTEFDWVLENILKGLALPYQKVTCP